MPSFTVKTRRQCLAFVVFQRDVRSMGCIWCQLCLYLLKCIPWSCVTRSRFNNKVASMCSSKELLCARVVCDCAKHHVHAINDTRATNSPRFFKELHVPRVSEMVHSSPHQPLQFGKSRLAGSSCHILRVTVYTHTIHTLTSLRKLLIIVHRTPA